MKKSWKRDDILPFDSSAYHSSVNDAAWKTVLPITSGGRGVASVYVRIDNTGLFSLRITIDGNLLPGTVFSFYQASTRPTLFFNTYEFLSTFLVEDMLAVGGGSLAATWVLYRQG